MRPRTLGLALARALAAGMIVVVAVGSGVGWLYVLWSAGALDAGARVASALPLQRLAGGDAQPLLRMLGAWLPAAALAAVALARVTRLPAGMRALVAGSGAWAALVLAGAASDAVTESEAVAAHLGAQTGRPAVWLPALLFAACSLVTRRRADRARRGARRAARRHVAGGIAAP